MKILMITDFYWPFEGGVEQHVRRLSHGLAQRGHTVTVATLGDGDLPAFELDGPVQVQRLRSSTQRIPTLFKNQSRPWAPPFPDPEVTRALYHLVRQAQPDIVHGHDWLARSFLPLKGRSGARLVMSLHYYTQSCAKKSLMYRGEPCSGPGVVKCLQCAAAHYGPAKGPPVAASSALMSAAERAAVDVFLPVSQATAEGNRIGSSSRCRVIPNFMPEHRTSDMDLRPYLSQLPSEEFLLFVGDLRPEKGIEVLLSAYAGLQSPPPLILIGKTWPESPKDFPPNVTLLRHWPNEAVLAAWQRCMMGIVPSLWPEPFGIVVIEAMAAGRPVVAAQSGGIPEIITSGQEGILTPPGDVPALRQAIEQLLASPELRAQMGSAARRKAAMYQAEVVVPLVEQVYQDLLKTSVQKDGWVAAGKHYRQQL